MKKIRLALTRTPALIAPAIISLFPLTMHIIDGNIPAVCGWSTAFWFWVILIWLVGSMYSPKNNTSSDATIQD